MQVDVRERHALGLLGVLEAHVVKVDGAIDDGVAWVAWVLEVGDLQQHLTDAPGALLRHGDHDEYHREHHEAHEHRDTIGDQGRHLAYVHGETARGDDGLGAKEDDGGVDDVDGEGH